VEGPHITILKGFHSYSHLPRERGKQYCRYYEAEAVTTKPPRPTSAFSKWFVAVALSVALVPAGFVVAYALDRFQVNRDLRAVSRAVDLPLTALRQKYVVSVFRWVPVGPNPKLPAGNSLVFWDAEANKDASEAVYLETPVKGSKELRELFRSKGRVVQQDTMLFYEQPEAPQALDERFTGSVFMVEHAGGFFETVGGRVTVDLTFLEGHLVKESRWITTF
jgi:hypothetical protein